MRQALLGAVLLAGVLAAGPSTLPSVQSQPAKKPETGDGEARLLRFPAVHGKQIVFTYAGNLYTVPTEGGTARKLTGHDGFEMFPRFSPDGKWIAFTGQYDGNTEVYVMPAEGGVPRRLTYTATLGRDEVSDRMGPNNIVIGWKNDGKHILFRSRMRSFNDFIGQLFLVPVEGGLPEQLPLPRGGFGSFSADDKKLVYNRVFREFRTWKRYRGGMADDLWVYDFDTKETKQLVKDDAQDIIPMWKGDRVYFLSDRDKNKRMNLYVHDLKTEKTRQLTEYTDFDIKFPSLGEDAIVYENGGWIYRFDLESEKATRVPIRIQEDLNSGRGGLIDVSKNITNAEISPDGKRALFGARGEVFSVPAESGSTRNLTRSSGVHERNSRWSPDGKWVAYVSDVSGEDEIYVTSPDGRSEPVQLTKGADTYKFEILWSPDSKKILWGDKKFRVQFVDVDTKKVTQVTQAKMWEVRDFAWAPDSKWVAWGQTEVEGMPRIHLYSLEQSKSWPATDGWQAARSPVFSADGKYLFFVSDRDFNPLYSRTEWNHAYQDTARIYLITLEKKTKSPFAPKSDEAAVKEEKKDDKKEPEKKEPVAVRVDVEGLSDRVIDLPVQAADYSSLASVGNVLYYLRRGSKDSQAALQMFDLAQRKETALGSVSGFEISADGKKMLVVQGNKYSIIDLPKATVNPTSSLSLSGLQVRLDRRAEWKQIFNESWRHMRDFFYDPNMHGVDWKGLRDRYAPLVDHVIHRADLSYVIGEMIGELNAGHAYVGGGDLPNVQRVLTGLLGADLARDPKTGYFQIKKILKGTSWDKKVRSPLYGVGVDAAEGDYIISVDGKDTSDLPNIYDALVNTVGKQVTLKLNKQPKDDKDSREVVVEPIADEADLRYYGWVQGNIKKVNDATEGRVGYIHIPDMLSTGLNEFVKQFYPQLKKKALIIDVRGNGGGNVSPMLIERLRRDLVMVGIARNGVPTTDPREMHLGPKVCLMNEFSASDGDLFPYRFKSYGLGKLIGKRSWGGVIGIRGTLPLLDGGTLNRPEFSRYDVEGKKWIIEGYGVDPDIVIDNDPAREFAGTDDQLNKSIEVILEQLKTQDKTLPDVPEFPKK